MNIFGAYHTDVRMRALGICDAPCISKGRMSLAGYDTASGPQRMALCYGSLRNRSQLTRKLECAPYASQALLVLKAYETWGDDYPEHIEGPCMSCVMDLERDRMLLVRDRMGECSIFYAQRDDRLVFSDHPDTLLKAAFIEPVLDRQGACELFGLGPARTPGHTPLNGLLSVEPGCMLICGAEGTYLKRYFALEAQPCEDNRQTIVARVRSLLEDAVGSFVHLHPACMLSGGIDSTALTALLCMHIGRVDTFSVDYAGNAQDFIPTAFRPEADAPYIHMAVRAFGTRHRNVVLEQEMLADALGRAVRFRGFPGMADIDASLLLFARVIARASRTVVSGECGDEVFGGYPWFREGAELSEEAFPWSGSMALREAVLRPEIREKLQLRAYVRDALHASLESYDVSAVEGEREKTLFRLQRLCFEYFMPNLQERASKMCESQGVTVLTPFCDDRLVRYVYNVPWEIKTLDGREKGLLREAVRDLLPEKLLNRKKSPYPKTCSNIYADLTRKNIRAMLSDPDAPILKLIDADCVERIAASRLDPADTPWFGQLMAGPQLLAYLLQINLWMQERNIRVEL